MIIRVFRWSAVVLLVLLCALPPPRTDAETEEPGSDFAPGRGCP